MSKQSNNKSESLAKITMIGEGSVGKTSILMRFTDGTFQVNMIPTLGIDYKLKRLNLKKGSMKLQIWDTAGQERFRAITENFFKGSLGIVFVFDLSNLKSLQQLDTWMSRVEQQECNDAVIIVIGNKSDLANGEVKREQIDEFLNKHNVKYYETSAKLNKGIDQAFQELSEEISTRFFPDMVGFSPPLKNVQPTQKQKENNLDSDEPDDNDSIIRPPGQPEKGKQPPKDKKKNENGSIVLSSIHSQQPNNHTKKKCCSS